MVVPARIELATHGFSVRCSTYWATEPLVAREGFEPTTSGLWARRATRLLYLAIWRRSWDSNPGAAFTTYRFSRPDPSATWVLLHFFVFKKLVDPEGLEPSTTRFRFAWVSLLPRLFLYHRLMSLGNGRCFLLLRRLYSSGSRWTFY